MNETRKKYFDKFQSIIKNVLLIFLMFDYNNFLFCLHIHYIFFLLINFGLRAYTAYDGLILGCQHCWNVIKFRL